MSVKSALQGRGFADFLTGVPSSQLVSARLRQTLSQKQGRRKLRKMADVNPWFPHTQRHILDAWDVLFICNKFRGTCSPLVLRGKKQTLSALLNVSPEPLLCDKQPAVLPRESQRMC